MAIADMSDNDAHELLKNIIEIMWLSDSAVTRGNSEFFPIYKLARASRDLMTFDALSRNVLKKLGAGEDLVVHGYLMTPEVMNEIATGRKINAIKELRGATGCGLKEAKDAVEAIWDEYAPKF